LFEHVCRIRTVSAIDLREYSWITLWKPAIDALGGILGERRPTLAPTR
jgi:hypothetical protein